MFIATFGSYAIASGGARARAVPGGINPMDYPADHPFRKAVAAQGGSLSFSEANAILRKANSNAEAAGQFFTWKGILSYGIWWYAGFVTGRVLTGAIGGAPATKSTDYLLTTSDTVSSAMKGLKTYTQWAGAATVSGVLQGVSLGVFIAPHWERWHGRELESSPNLMAFLGGAAYGAFTWARDYWRSLPQTTGPNVQLAIDTINRTQTDFFGAQAKFRDWWFSKPMELGNWVKDKATQFKPDWEWFMDIYN